MILTNDVNEPKFDHISPQPLMPLLPLSSSDEGFTVEGIAAEEEEEGRQSRLGIREGERDDESRLRGEPEDWTSYRSEDCLTYEDCLDNCLESPSQMQFQEKKMRPDCTLVPPLCSDRKEEDSAEFKDAERQQSDVCEQEPNEADFRLQKSPEPNQKSEDPKSDKQQHGVVQCGVVLVDKQIARRSPLNSAKPPTENFFLSSFRRGNDNMTAANSLSAIGETVNKKKDFPKKREDSLKPEAEQINTQTEISRGKKKEQDVKVKNEIKRDEEQKKTKEEEQKKLAARKSREMNQTKGKEIIRRNGQEVPKGIKSRDPKTKSLTTDLLKDPEKSPTKQATLSKKSSDKSVKKSVSAPSVPLDPASKRKISSSSSSATIASESLASRAKHSSQERLRKLKKTITTSREEAKPRPVTTPTSSPSKRVHRTSSCSSSSSTKSSKSGSLTISSSYSSKSGSLSLSSTPSPTSNAEGLRDSKVAPNHSKRSSPKSPTQHLITMKDQDTRRHPSVSSPSSSTKKKTPLVLEDPGGKQTVQVSYAQ